MSRVTGNYGKREREQKTGKGRQVLSTVPYRVGLAYFGQLRKDSVISQINEQH